MRHNQAVELLLAATAVTGGTVSERANKLLAILRRVVPFDGAWLALADTDGRAYHRLATIGLDDACAALVSDAVMARCSERVAADDHGRRPPSRADRYRRLPAWADEFAVTEFAGMLPVALSSPTGQHVGFLALLFCDGKAPGTAVQRRVSRLAAVLANGIDPMRPVISAASLIPNAAAGVVLRVDGGCQRLPSLPAHPLLVHDSPVVAAARERIDDGHVYSSFLWRTGDRCTPAEHLRVTVLAVGENLPPGLAAVVVLSPAADLRGLTPRELEVLGLLIEGCSNPEIARALVVAPRTVAAHLEHVLAKLGTATRTLAAVRAERDGLYIPPCRVGGSRHSSARSGAGSRAGSLG